MYICDRCIPRADAALATGAAATSAARPIEAVREEARAERCSFCGKCRYQVPGMATALGIRICTECLELCHEIRDERLT